jgi:hypothetical protein
VRDISLIVVHHSASAPTTTWRQIGFWHAARFKLGLGYHRVIQSDGFSYDGRKLQRPGAHAPPNAKRIGICLTGDNTKVGWGWNELQENHLYNLLLYLHKTWPGVRACGHRDVPGARTLCPGLDFDDWLHGNGLGHLIINLRRT